MTVLATNNNLKGDLNYKLDFKEVEGFGLPDRKTP